MIKKKTESKPKKRIISILFVLLISILTSFLFYQFDKYDYFTSVNNGILDSVNSYEKDIKVDDIVIVGIDDKSIIELGKWPWRTKTFSDFLDKIPKSSTVGFGVGFFEKSVLESDDMDFKNSILNHSNVILSSQIEKIERDETGEIKEVEILKPNEILLNSTKAGYVNFNLGNDGIVRELDFDLDKSSKHFTYEIYKSYFKKEPIIPKNFLINYIGENEEFKVLSFYNILEGNYEEKDIENKIILVGSIDSILTELYKIPSTDKRISSIEIQANVLNTLILQNNYKIQETTFLILIVFISFFVIGLVTYSSKNLYGLILTIAFVLSYFYITSIFLLREEKILNFFCVLISSFSSYLLFTLAGFFNVSKSRKVLKDAFGKYLDKNLVEQISQGGEKVKLGGEKKNMTVFFLDIENFTGTSESMDPAHLVHYLNICLTKITNVLINHRGVIDKYIGDAIMAFWNAPLNNQNQYIDACNATLDVHKLRDVLRKELKNPNLNYRIGLNCGECVVGNVGSDTRLDYTVIGDTINLAARLESINKQYKTNILISEDLEKKIKGKFFTRLVDKVRVKGKKVGKNIYELISRMDEIPHNMKKFVGAYERGFDLYQHEDFTLAIKEFENALHFKKGDKSCEVLIKRCKYLKHHKPRNWDGVFTAEEK